MLVFVQNKHGEALMPCKPRKARLLLKAKKAVIVSYKPFTIKLLYGSSGYKQAVNVGVDLGTKHTGIAITSQNNVLTKGEIELRQDVKSLLNTRRIYRRSRRNRKTRYRKPRFQNRKRPEGWLPPSIRSRVDNTFFWIDKFCSLVPNPNLTIEVGKFDPHKMINLDIQGVDYQKGQTYGYYDVRYFVFARDQYTCQVCKKKNKILKTHHIVYRSYGGTDRADNFITVCTDCHTHENHQKGAIFWKWMNEGKKLLRYKEGTFMNIFRKRVFTKYPQAEITYGSITTPRRKELGLEKSHANDAIAISGIELIHHNEESIFKIKQFRKKKRSLHEATARKGRTTKNVTCKRNLKNVKQLKGFYLNDKVRVYGQVGFITGFTGTSMAYVKDIHNQYIKKSNKIYKQVNLKDLTLISHNNNWQYEQSL
ncbi:paclitaxel/taxanoid biosynthesis susceptibility protein ts1 [Bacillus methanolicus PB1]|uniref:Paclitaxel/taxanoid biosynthesis susceptibility protein ts1 n=1 Tax=Bacillus methanolicus PB1 TaxID=997296 RepID=I3E173_BACMT|nr:RNA-guided endonuclease IscB [Bacillus methanolicus]EIJ80244.1 paclitaxel/taxanoid biosynthesis susceptibility protein ts1 [Bacillus methanolicus PB1]